jgi:hypothetical protein
MIQRIEIQFPTDVELPDGFEQLLNAAVDMVCKQYQRTHPAHVMWAAEHGSKMLSNPFMVSDDEPLKFDDSTYYIGVSVQDDTGGLNPHNPRRAELQEKRVEAFSSERAASKDNARRYQQVRQLLFASDNSSIARLLQGMPSPENPADLDKALDHLYLKAPYACTP